MVYKIVTVLGIAYEIGVANYDVNATVEAIEYEHSSLDPQSFVVQFNNGMSVEIHNPVEVWRRKEQPSPWVTNQGR